MIHQKSDGPCRVLDFINKANSTSILAFTNQSEDDAKFFLNHQPFRSLQAIRNVIIVRETTRGSKRRKVEVPIGDEIVSGLWDVVTAKKAAEAVVDQGRKKIDRIQSIISKWNRQQNGRYKPSAGIEDVGTDDEDLFGSQKPATYDYQRGSDGSRDDDEDQFISPRRKRSNQNDQHSYVDYDTEDEVGADDVGYGDTVYEQDSEKGWDSDGEDEDDGDHQNCTHEGASSEDGDDPAKPGPVDLEAFKKGSVNPATGLKNLPFSMPSMMRDHCKLKRHQWYGLNYLALLRSLNLPAILADDMGLGKTCTIIALIACLIETDFGPARGNGKWPNIVIVPPSTLNNWRQEFMKFAPGVRVIEYRGQLRCLLQIVF